MRFFKDLTAVILAGLLILPPAPLAAKTRKGEKLRKDAQLEEVKGNLDHALELALAAAQDDPQDPAYNLEVQRLRFSTAAMHVRNGQKLRADGKVAESLAEFEKAYAIDPASDVAAQEIRRTRQMLERNKTGKLDDDAQSLTPAELARKRIQERTDALLPVPELRPLNNEPIDLKMTNRPRTLFETLAKTAGINIVFDPDYNGDKQAMTSVQIDLVRTNLDDALNQLSMLTRSFWKPLSPNTIFVTTDNAGKRGEYSEHVMKIFYLSNATTPQELAEMLTVLRTIVGATKVFSYTAQNAIVVRDTAEVVALAEKLVADLDKPRAEVIIDVLVMQASSGYVRNLTAAFAPTGINTGVSFLPRPGITTPLVQATTTTTTTATTSGTTTGTTGNGNATTIPLNALGRISSADYSIANLPGAQFEALMTDSRTRILQSPQIRATNNVKATIKIGDKIPIATGSFQPGVGAVGASPLVNTQFTYQDVGVKVEILPQVHDNNEISLHLDLDVSSLKDRIDIGGITQPEISQNTVTADIRLREGEINLIGGLMTQSESKSISGLPGLASLPILGRFFSSDKSTRDRSELVIALIPHIVRGLDITEANLRGVASGNANTYRIGYGPRASQLAAAAGAPIATATMPAASVGDTPSVPSIPAILGLPAAAPPATAPPENANAVPPPPPGAGEPRIGFLQTTMNTQLGSTAALVLQGSNITDMASAAVQLQYDPKILRITSVVAGDLSQRNTPQMLTPVTNIVEASGVADVSVIRPNGGVTGTGGLITVVFQAMGRGNTAVRLTKVGLTNAAGTAMGVVVPPPVVVNVQ